MSVLPIVSPAHNADGVALQPLITAIYPFALDEGSVDATTCFLVKKVSSGGTNSTTQIPVRVDLKRLQLTSNSEYTGFDFGGDLNSGEKYRSQITISPATQLSPHSNYSVILSKDIAKKSVFDVVANPTNTGSQIPIMKGPYSGLTANEYKVEIVIGGSESLAKYKVTRISDNHVINNLTAKKRFIEIERGLFIKFDTGTYVAGDFFNVIVKPLVKTNEIYSWDFSTGDSNYVQPQDQNSSVIIGLPVNNSAPGSSTPGSSFKLVSVSPKLDSIMNNPANKIVTFTFNKNIKPSSVTADKIKLIAESTATNYYGSLDYAFAVEDNKIIITFD